MSRSVVCLVLILLSSFCLPVVFLSDFSADLVLLSFLCVRRGLVGVLFQFMSEGVYYIRDQGLALCFVEEFISLFLVITDVAFFSFLFFFFSLRLAYYS